MPSRDSHPPVASLLPAAERRILVVDDEPETLDMLQSLLMRWGYDVATASNGVEALTQSKESGPGLLLTDLSMPQMDGVELCRRSKAQRHLRLVPILVATGLPALPVALHGVVEAFFPKAGRLLSAAECGCLLPARRVMHEPVEYASGRHLCRVHRAHPAPDSPSATC